VGVPDRYPAPETAESFELNLDNVPERVDAKNTTYHGA
jgi:hypothetical protein